MSKSSSQIIRRTLYRGTTTDIGTLSRMASKSPNKKIDASSSGSGAPAASENVASTGATAFPQPGAATRVITNITKMVAESTARGGGPKLKFTPNMPARRKKPEYVCHMATHPNLTYILQRRGEGKLKKFIYPDT